MAKKQKTDKTNAMRQLDSAGIVYEMGEYEYDESDLSGVHAAEALGVSEDEVFKTLVTRGDDNNLFVFVIPSGATLDLKKAAKVSGNKKIDMIHVKEIFDFTGYIRGGCSPIGMKKQFRTFIHLTAEDFDTIYCSGGKIGFQIELPLSTLRKVIRVESADLIR